MHRLKTRHLTLATASATLAAAASPATTLISTVPDQAVALSPAYETVALLSVGDRRPLTSDPTREYQMVGIPDGLGAHRNPHGTVTVYMNHELVKTALSEPIVGAPLNRGAFVSKLLLAADGTVLSGDRAYDRVYLDDVFVGPAADTSNSTPAFGRFCSGFLASGREGFDRKIYLANEETDPAGSFDGLGGLAVAIFDGEAHGLRDLGHFPWENALVQPTGGHRTVILCMEDGPTSQIPAQDNSQLYMYVGFKDHSPGATVLQRNGLVGGTLYVFRSLDPLRNSELAFQNGALLGEWVALPPAGALNQSQLEAASDAAGAMVFARPEDGCFNPRARNNYFFVTTGGAAGANDLGRLYSLELDPADPTLPARLTIAYNADQIIAAGGDIAVSPDNIDASSGFLMICEDGTAQSRPVMASRNRDGSIWQIRLLGQGGVDMSTAARAVELAPPGRDGVAVGAGIWETSGVIDARPMFGAGAWLFDVQAHSPTAAPFPNTVEDGQLLLLRRIQP